VDFALRIASVNGVGQTPAAADENDCLLVLNLLISEWQMNRWLVPNLQSANITSTAAASYAVGPGGTFALSSLGQRPDRIDTAFARLIATGADTYLYPFMAREGFDRVAAKASAGPPEAFFYEPVSATVGTIYFYPVPANTWQLFIKAKADLQLFVALTDNLSPYPAQYVVALLWNLAERIRPLYGMQPRPDISAMAAQSLVAIGGSTAQMIQAQQPAPSARAGVFSHVVAPQAGQ
jgi:hypothetical protein